jgi:hypothetical protein
MKCEEIHIGGVGVGLISQASRLKDSGTIKISIRYPWLKA